MERDNVVEPHRKIGKVFRQDFLHFTAQEFPFFLIYFHANLVGQRVYARVAVVSAIGAVGRKSL